MNIIKNIFWNTEESRLRAAYRILIEIIAYLAIYEVLALFIDYPQEISGNTSLLIILAIAGIRLVRGLLSVFLTGRFFDRRAFRDFGFNINKNWWIDLCFGMLLGIILMGGIFLIQYSAGWLSISDTLYTSKPDQSFILSFSVFVFLFICVGFSEELFYRGYLLTNLSEGFNFKGIGPRKSIFIAILFSSLLFGFFHLGSPNASLVSTLIIILAGLLFSIPFLITGSLAIPIGLHITWNLCQGNVFGFPISGTTFSSESVSIFSIKQLGPDMWTGGSFGPEAGLLGLFAIILGLVIILGWIKVRRGSLNLHTEISEAPK